MPKEKQASLYEGMYILSATLSDEAKQKALAKIEKEIADFGGEVLKVFDQGRQKLAYKIDGKQQGHYYVIYFQTKPSAVPQMWQEYRLNEDLMRFVTLSVNAVPETLECKPLLGIEA